MGAAQFLIDTSTLARLLGGNTEQYGGDQAVVATTAELQGLPLLHRDHDFTCVAAVTGQAMQWYGPEAGK
ncbi:hypothetical protein [Streptomyces sp. NPDC088141]|uniref:hypothetical protein n=1 Tax=unclassified Streptomyces TaxID=2593676 RepID=UPI003449C102